MKRTQALGARGGRWARGFTLIELLITVVIIAILAAIALPSYTNYVIRGKIPEATGALAAGRIAAEQWYQDNRTYATFGCPSSTPHFTLTCPTLTATTYTITATGLGDLSSFSYSINQAGVKSSTTPWGGTNASCWVMNSSGGC